MKHEKHPVDDFFKEALQDHHQRPSDAVRKRFLNEAANFELNRKRSRLPWLLLLGGLIVATSAILILGLYEGEESEVRSQESEVRSQESEVRSQVSEVRSQESEVRSQVSEVKIRNSEADNKRLAYDGSGHKVDFKVDFSSTPVSMATSDEGVSPAIIPPSTAISVEQPPPNQVSESLPDSTELTTLYLLKEDTVIKTEPLPIPEKEKRMKRSSDWQFATSLYYAPEWMFNTLEGDKFVSNFGLEESFRYGRYILKTGIGLSIGKGTNELMVEYNDYLGSFNQLDSIEFNWDEKNYYLLPTYYTSDIDVWDSLLQLDYQKVVKRYTYLQVPLILGYDVLQKKWISLGFRAGPILSLLIQSKQLSGEYDPGKNQIIRINQVTPDRVQTNWQIMGGINVSLPISKRFGFEIEPNIKYYFNSVYEKSDASKKPWSVGFRASFSIRY